MIELSDVVKRYGPRLALSGVTLSIPDAAVYGLIGPNGAGKTTLLRILAGLSRPTSGRVARGDRPDGRGSESGAVGYLPQRVTFNPRATPRETLRLFVALRGLPMPASDEALEHGGLTADADRRIDVLSGGMRQRLGLAIACLGRPGIVLLDEPSAGLDPRAAIDLRSRVRAMAASGQTVVISSHSLPDLEAVCDGLAMLVDGRVVAAGPVALLKSRTLSGSLDDLFLEAAS